jgi:hypothetical protein
MRNSVFALCVAVSATSAVAAPPPPSEPQVQIPPELTDPAMADRLAGMAQALSKAFLDLPVGEVEAAAEGRSATPRERKMTVRDAGRRDDPDFDRHFEQQIANARPVIEKSMQAFAKSLPAMNRALSEMAEQMRQMTDTLPSPQQ